jgi:hypothetical protein
MNTLSTLLLEKTPKYEITVPSSNKKTSFRPFLVKEEKILLIAQETGSYKEMLQAIEQVIESCVDGIEDASSLPIFDIEYLFLRLRAKSVSEIATPTIQCPETNENIELQVNLVDIEPTLDERHKKNIKIDDDIVIDMKYPTLKMMRDNEDDASYDDPESFYGIIVDCIDTIKTKDDTINVSSLPRNEIEDFIGNMNKTQFEKILDFFITSPQLKHTAKYTTSDGVEREVVLRGISDFLE